MSRQNKNRNKRLVAREMSDKRILRPERKKPHDALTIQAALKRDESHAS